MPSLNSNPFSRVLNGLLLIAFLLVVFNISIPVSAQASPYRLVYTVDNTGILINNYQVEVILDTATLITKFKMKPDCADIRVTDTASLAYNFWVESGCNTVNTKVIVNIPAVNTGTTTFWLDYGNFSLTSLSNPAGTTVFSDQMLTSTTCSLGGSAVYDSANQWVRLNAVTQGAGSCNYSYNPGNGFKAKFDFWTGGGTGADSVWFYAFDTSIPNQEDVTTGGYHFTYDEYQDRVCFTRSNAGNGAGIACASVTNLDNSTWKSAEVRYYNHQAWIYIDGVLITTAINPAPIASTAGNFFGFASRTGGLTNEHRIRKTYVSKFSPFITLNPPSEQVYMSMNIRDVNNSINLNTCDFGIASTLANSQCRYRIAVNTNATNRYQLFSQTSGGLKNINSPYVINNALAGTGTGGGNQINNANNGIEKYGVKINPGNTTAGNTTLLPSTPFYVGTILTNANSTNFSHLTSTLTVQSLYPNLPLLSDTTNTILMTHNLNISPATPAGNYSQKITYTLVAGF